ncbi:hypothetical protein ACFYO7_07525 [Nocardia salmonicida]
MGDHVGLLIGHKHQLHKQYYRAMIYTMSHRLTRSKLATAT